MESPLGAAALGLQCRCTQGAGRKSQLGESKPAPCLSPVPSGADEKQRKEANAGGRGGRGGEEEPACSHVDWAHALSLLSRCRLGTTRDCQSGPPKQRISFAADSLGALRPAAPLAASVFPTCRCMPKNSLLAGRKLACQEARFFLSMPALACYFSVCGEYSRTYRRAPKRTLVNLKEAPGLWAEKLQRGALRRRGTAAKTPKCG